MNAPLPYGRQSIGEEEIGLVQDVLRSDWLTQGPTVPRFEQALAAACDAPFAVAAANGTLALYLACRAAGLGPGDRFLTSPITFAATANAAVLCGAEPVFADIDLATGNLDCDQVEAALAADPRIRVVLPVHLGGLVGDLEKLTAAARRYGAVVIEDACHAVGGQWRDRAGAWHRVGSCRHAAMACFSFHPVKNITTGEGGAVLTRDPDLAEKLALLRTHGITRDPGRMREHHGGWYYEMHDLGLNARLTDLQAAIGLAQLARLEAWRRRRLALVERYDQGLRDLPAVATQARPAGEDRTCWHLMIVRSSRRDALYRGLHEAGILAQVHYIPVHLQPYYRDRFGTGPGDHPRAERHYAETISLPLYPGLTDDQCDRVIEAVRTLLKDAPALRETDDRHG